MSSTLEDTELVLEKLSRREIELIKEIEQQFKHQTQYMKRIDELGSFTPNVKSVEACNRKLASLVDSSLELVEEVCSKVRKLDKAKARLDESLSKIGDILDLETCRTTTRDSLEAQEYEKAAAYIKRYLDIDQDSLRSTIKIIQKQHPIDPVYMEQCLAQLADYKSQLLRICREQLIKATVEDCKPDVDRFLKIFPLIGERKDGLDRFANYLCTKIVDPTSFKNKSHVDRLSALYESVAKIIHDHQHIIETYYGPGYLIAVVPKIQKECDRFSRKILEQFRNETNLQQIARVVRDSSMPSTQSPIGGQSKLDPRTIDNLLNNFSLIISRSEVYLSFIISRLKDDLKPDQTNLFQIYNVMCVDCALNHMIQEVSDIYVMLEQYYLNESSKKAIMLDQVEVDHSNNHLSSMLDDIFFIMNNSTKRAISTKGTDVFCAIINSCVTLLESTFLKVLEDRIRNQQYFSIGFTPNNYLQTASELEKTKAQYFSALNNLDKACNYINKLRDILEEGSKKLRPPLFSLQRESLQAEKSISCLNELSSLVPKFQTSIRSSLYLLFNSLLRNKFLTELKSLIAENPDISSLQNTNDIKSLSSNLIGIIDKSLEKCLRPENFQRLVAIAANHMITFVQK